MCRAHTRLTAHNFYAIALECTTHNIRSAYAAKRVNKSARSDGDADDDDGKLKQPRAPS